MTGDLPASNTSVSEGTLMYMPEKENLARTNYAFTGWMLNGKLYQPGETFTMPSENVTITACWKEATYRISGIVDQEGNPLVHAVVTLKRGSNIVAETLTDPNGKYSFTGVMPGMYNLITSYDGITTTVKVLIVDADAEQNATLSTGRTNSILDVAEGSPTVIVGNLEKLFQTSENTPVYPQIYTENDKTVVENGGSVEIRLTVKKVAEPDQTGAELLQEAIQKLPESFDYQPELYLDLLLEKTEYSMEDSGVEASQTETLSDSQVVLESVISLPSNLQSRKNYKVYRIHQNSLDDEIVLEELMTEANAEGEYYELNSDNTEMTIHARKYSVYTVAASDYVELQPENPEVPTGGESHPEIGLPVEEQKVENSHADVKPLEQEKTLSEESDPEMEIIEENPEIIPEQITEDQIPEKEQMEETKPQEKKGKSFVVLNVMLTLLSLVMAVRLLLRKQDLGRTIAAVTAAAASVLILMLTFGFDEVRIADLSTIVFALSAAITVMMNRTNSKHDKA